MTIKCTLYNDLLAPGVYIPLTIIIVFSSPNRGTRKTHIALPSRRKTSMGVQMFGFRVGLLKMKRQDPAARLQITELNSNLQAFNHKVQWLSVKKHCPKSHP